MQCCNVVCIHRGVTWLTGTLNGKLAIGATNVATDASNGAGLWQGDTTINTNVVDANSRQ